MVKTCLTDPRSVLRPQVGKCIENGDLDVTKLDLAGNQLTDLALAEFLQMLIKLTLYSVKKCVIDTI